MKSILMVLALLLATSASASDPGDFARQWPVLGHCGPGAGKVAPEDEKPVQCEGAFALVKSA